MTTEQTFEEAIEEYISHTRAMIGEEVMENLPPDPPSPIDQSGPPYEATLRLDERTVRNYALSIGDDNPLYTDPEYGRRSRYGSQLAPGPILALIRYPSAHGAKRPQGYPMANFISGTAWEFYDVIRAGAKFRSSKVTKELIERSGSQGKLVFLISECYYHDFHGDMPAKCYGTQIMVPQRNMESSRAVPRERLGQHMMYERKASQYSPEQIEKYVGMIEGFRPRGAEPLYWEDVQMWATKSAPTFCRRGPSRTRCRVTSWTTAPRRRRICPATSWPSSLPTTTPAKPANGCACIPSPAGLGRPALSTKTRCWPSIGDCPAPSTSEYSGSRFPPSC